MKKVALIFGLLFCVTAGVFILEPQTLERRTALVARAGALLTIVLMTLASWSLRRDPMATWIYTICGIVAAALTLLLIPVSRAAAPYAIPAPQADDLAGEA